MKRQSFIALLMLLTFCVGSPMQVSAQTVIDLHTGKISGKTRDDYNVKTREAWQLREDSIQYNDCVTRAFNFLHADSLQAAQSLFEKALKLRPDAPGNVVVRHNIGRIFMARKQWKDGISMLSRVLADQSSNVEVREDRATCYVQAGLYDKALRDYDYLLALRPDDMQYRLFHAMMLSHTGAKRDALDELDVIIEAHDDYADCYLVRAALHAELGSKGYARRDLDRAVALGIPKAEIQELYEQLK